MMLTPLIDAKREYLQRGDYNLFFVDWVEFKFFVLLN